MTTYVTSTVVDQNDVPVVGAQVYVYADGALASLEDVNGDPLGNPLTSAANGFFEAYSATNGKIVLRYFWGGKLRYIEVPSDEALINAAALSAATAEAVSGPTYASTVAGLAATTDGQSFAVDNGDGTVTIYLNSSGVAVSQRNLTTTAALTSMASGSGADLVARSGPSVATRAVMAGFSTSVHDHLQLLEAGREGFFAWDGADHTADVTADPEQGLFVAPTGDATGASGAWVRRYDGFAQAKWWGAKNSTTLNAALTACKTLGLPLQATGDGWSCTATVVAREQEVDFGSAKFTIDHAGIGIVCGGNASGRNPDQIIGDWTRNVGTSDSVTPDVQIRGAKNQRVEIDFARYVQLYADTEASVRDTDYSIAYCRFFFKDAQTLELTNNPANAGGANDALAGGTVQWINENEFTLIRTRDILMNGTYAHNGNTFNWGGAEPGAASAFVLNVDEGRDNRFIGVRAEGGVGGTFDVDFGADATRNVVLFDYAESEFDAFPNLPSHFNITDNNGGNIVQPSLMQSYNRAVVAFASINDVVLNNTVGSTRLPRLQRIVSGGNQPFIETEFLPVRLFDYFVWHAFGENSGDSVLYRGQLEFFDNQQNPVASAAGFVTSPALTNVSGSTVSMTTGGNDFAARINAAAVSGAAFVKARFLTSSGQTANALARFAHIEMFTQAPELPPRQDRTQPAAVSATPTQGFAPKNYRVANETGPGFAACIEAVDTALNGSAASGASTIDVDDATNIADGDNIGINLDNRDTHWTTVNGAPAGNTITLTANMPSDAADGSRVVTNRWAQIT